MEFFSNLTDSGNLDRVKAMFKMEDLLPFPKTFNFLCFELRRGCNSVTLSSCRSRR